MCTHTRDSNCSRTVLPPPLTNSCIIFSGRKGPVSFSLLSSDTSQTSEGVAKGLMMPLLKATTCLYGMADQAYYLLPSLNVSQYFLHLPPLFFLLCAPPQVSHVMFFQISVLSYLSTRCSQCVPHEQFGITLQFSDRLFAYLACPPRLVSAD